MKKDNEHIIVSSGTSLSTLLTVAFVVLKLCNIITWSWFWVLSPIIFSIGIFILVLIIGIIIAVIIANL